MDNDFEPRQMSELDRNFEIMLNICREREEDSDNPVEVLEIDSKYVLMDDVHCELPNDMKPKYSMLNINIQGLCSSFDKLKIMLSRLKENGVRFDFILLCETFLVGNDQTKLCNLNGYNMVTRKRGGGLAIYIKDKYSFGRKMNFLNTWRENSSPWLLKLKH